LASLREAAFTAFTGTGVILRIQLSSASLRDLCGKKTPLFQDLFSAWFEGFLLRSLSAVALGKAGVRALCY
jgi:hypothetical protein